MLDWLIGIRLKYEVHVMTTSRALGRADTLDNEMECAKKRIFHIIKHDELRPLGRVPNDTRAASWKTSETPRLCLELHSAVRERKRKGVKSKGTKQEC